MLDSSGFCWQGVRGELPHQSAGSSARAAALNWPSLPKSGLQGAQPCVGSRLFLRLHTAMSQSLSPDAWRKPKAGQSPHFASSSCWPQPRGEVTCHGQDHPSAHSDQRKHVRLVFASWPKQGWGFTIKSVSGTGQSPEAPHFGFQLECRLVMPNTWSPDGISEQFP